MNSLPPMLNHLALIIDIREDRLERTSIPFLRRLIAAELEVLYQRFQNEYQLFVRMTGQEPSAVLVHPAA